MFRRRGCRFVHVCNVTYIYKYEMLLMYRDVLVVGVGQWPLFTTTTRNPNHNHHHQPHHPHPTTTTTTTTATAITATTTTITTTATAYKRARERCLVFQYHRALYFPTSYSSRLAVTLNSRQLNNRLIDLQFFFILTVNTMMMLRVLVMISIVTIIAIPGETANDTNLLRGKYTYMNFLIIRKSKYF